MFIHSRESRRRRKVRRDQAAAAAVRVAVRRASGAKVVLADVNLIHSGCKQAIRAARASGNDCVGADTVELGDDAGLSGRCTRA